MIQDTESLVCEDIKRRQMVGVVKYETTVAASQLELREWLQHAYEECLDQAVYLKRAIQEMDANVCTNTSDCRSNGFAANEGAN
jgi:ribosomal protein S24E